jgi:hypothetical protein
VNWEEHRIDNIAATFQTREKILDVGPIHASRDKEHNVPYGQLAGGILAIGGVILLVKSKA